MKTFLNLSLVFATFTTSSAFANTCNVNLRGMKIPVTEKTISVLTAKGYNVKVDDFDSDDRTSFLILRGQAARIFGCVASATLSAPRGADSSGPTLAHVEFPRLTKACDQGTNEAIQALPTCSQILSIYQK